MNKISYSQYSLWANCQLAWKLKYVDGYRIDDSTINLIFGTAMHEVIQEWLDILYNKSEKVASHIDLSEGLLDKLKTLFADNITVDADGNKIFLCDKAELIKFYEQGCAILDYIQAHWKKIFPTKDVKLFAIEYELNIEVSKNVFFIGFIDVVTHDTKANKYYLYDLKTSKSGWSDYQKKDATKVAQLLLYKKFFSQQFNIPRKDIDVEFIILKRIIQEHSQFTIPRVSKFKPANGDPSVKKAWASMEKFITECFDAEGGYKTDTILPSPSKSTCRFCAFRERKDLCQVGI